MLRSGLLAPLLLLAAIALVRCSGSANAFLGASQGLRVRSAGRHVANGSPLPSSPRFSEQENNSCAWLPLALGVALAGASVSSRSQRSQNAMRRKIGTFKPKIVRKAEDADGDGKVVDSDDDDDDDDDVEKEGKLPWSKKFPNWVKKAGTPDAEAGTPPWMTMQKFNSLARGVARSPNGKVRSKQYFWQRFDDNGKDYTASEYTIATALDTLFTMSTRMPGVDPLENSYYAGGIEVNMKLNLDLKKPDEQLRLQVKLPHPTGRERKVAVFCTAAEEAEVMEMGAHIAGTALEKAIKDEEFDFDVLITKPAMMPQIAKLGKILGPRRLTPSPKAGTVTQDFKEGIENFKYERLIEVKPNGTPTSNKKPQTYVTNRAVIGKMTMGKDKILENVKHYLQSVAENCPAGCRKKEVFYNSVSIHYVGGPSLRLKESAFPSHPRDLDEDRIEEDEAKLMVMTKRR
mmetsp:Transcript_9450/g.16784  ORF Transcript_9450/g.16784 Transcript_9450/m.16784 type:complete len:459 (+) Transcript_9450:60-1436(+)